VGSSECLLSLARQLFVFRQQRLGVLDALELGEIAAEDVQLDGEDLFLESGQAG
jgi:hypothetical protein